MRTDMRPEMQWVIDIILGMAAGFLVFGLMAIASWLL